MAHQPDGKEFRPADLIAEQPELINTLAALAGVRIPEASAEAVRGHLLTAARMAQLLYATPLPDHVLDFAAVFTPADGLAEGQNGD